MKVPSAKPYFEDIGGIVKDVKEVLESGRLILGPYTEKLEHMFKDYVGVKYATAVSSATSALEIVMKHFDVRDKEVIVPANTFIACPNSVIYAGGKPVFVEISPDTYCMDYNDVLEKTTSKTTGIMVVHLAGLPVPEINVIREICDDHDLFLLEDASHAHGATIDGYKIGSLGDAACFSFYPTKNMTTGVGGIITSNNEKITEFAKSVRHHGQGESLDRITNFGNNWLMDELSAILGIYQLGRLEEHVKRRNEIAQKYMKAIDKLSDIRYFKVPQNMRHGYYKFLATLDDNINKQKLIDSMRNKYNIEVGTLYMLPCHLHPIYRQLGYKDGMLPITEEALHHQISLPLFAQMSEEEVSYVVECLESVLGEI